MDSFVTNALKYLESHKNFCDNWTEMYKNRVYSPIDEEEIDAGTVNSYLFLYFLSLFSLALAHHARCGEASSTRLA